MDMPNSSESSQFQIVFKIYICTFGEYCTCLFVEGRRVLRRGSKVTGPGLEDDPSSIANTLGFSSKRECNPEQRSDHTLFLGPSQVFVGTCSFMYTLFS